MGTHSCKPILSASDFQPVQYCNFIILLISPHCSVDPDQLARSQLHDLDLHCIQNKQFEKLAVPLLGWIPYCKFIVYRMNIYCKLENVFGGH